MTSLAQLVTDTRSILYGMELVERPAEDTLNGAITVGATSLTPWTPSMWFKDNYAEFDDGEIVIFEGDSAGATVVRRGQRGSTAAAQASGAVMSKNPLYTRVEIEKQVEKVVRTRLWPHVWTWHKDSLTAVDTDSMYDLDQYIDEVVMVYQENLDGEEKFHPIPNGWWDVERQIHSTVATQGGLLRIRKVWDYDEPVYFTAKRRPHVDDLTTLADELADMIPTAAAALSVAYRNPQVMNDAARSRRSPEPLLQAYRGLMAEFFQERDEYKRTLHKEVRPEPRFRKRFSRATW
jgi:hypothetical protein